MPRTRLKPDGLPYRVYERRGSRYYSIGYKLVTGEWAFRLRCKADQPTQIAELRRAALLRAAQLRIANAAIASGTSASVDLASFGALITAWFAWQEAKSAGSAERRAASTLTENRREAMNLRKAFGHMPLITLKKADAYAYLDACDRAKGPDGQPRPRAEKGNKEIALARLILEYGVRQGLLDTNPFMDVTKLRTTKSFRFVTDAELALAVRVGRTMGAPQHLCALALKTAYLCVKRSVEVRALKRDQITTQGIVWTAAKRQGGQAEQVGTIQWSNELQATVQEALAIKRNKLAGSMLVFGNMQGQRYTKGGWKATLEKLMARCAEVAQAEGVPFERFSLQDCRPKGVTDKLSSGQTDVMDATLHTNPKMIQTVYDRRRTRSAKPVL
jgi:integrase